MQSFYRQVIHGNAFNMIVNTRQKQPRSKENKETKPKQDNKMALHVFSGLIQFLGDTL